MVHFEELDEYGSFNIIADWDLRADICCGGNVDELWNFPSAIRAKFDGKFAICDTKHCSVLIELCITFIRHSVLQIVFHVKLPQ